jgi:cytochrome c biogenesis protein CcdA
MIADALGLTPQIGLAGALLGGVLSLISPCSALLLPSFFAYAFNRVGTLVVRTLVFYAGLMAVLVPLGAGVGAIGSLLTVHRSTVTMVGGIVVIALGVMVAIGGGFRIPGVSGALGRLRVGSLATVFALGALYGLAGFCAGPLLGGVLTVAAAGGSPAYGGLLMGVYALGMAAPLFVLALAWDRFHLGQRSWLRGRQFHVGRFRLHTTSLVSGLLFVAIGLLFVTTSGTANIGVPMGVDTQYTLQVWLQGVTSHLTDLSVLFGVALAILLGFVAHILLRSRRTSRPASRHGSGADRQASPHGQRVDSR